MNRSRVLYNISNGIFRKLSSVALTDEGNSDQGNTKNEFTGWDKWMDGTFSFVGDILDWVKPVLYAIMAIVGAAGAIYAIVLGVQLAKAEDTSKRDEAKKHLVTVLIAVAITVAFVIFFNEWLIDQILVAFFKPNAMDDTLFKD